VEKVVFAAWIFATWPLPPATWIAVGKRFVDCNPAFEANPVVQVVADEHLHLITVASLQLLLLQSSQLQ
jgi:hypothetical protein